MLVLPSLVRPVVGIAVDSGDTPPRAVATLLWLLDENPTAWQVWLPAGMVILLWTTGGLSAAAMRLPGLKPALRSYRLAAFAELAAGLLDHGVPLDETLTLAAEASGDRPLARDAHVAAEKLRSGAAAADAFAVFRSMPRFARWMVTAGATQGTLGATLRQVADWAARKGATRADWFALLAPLAVTLLVGGTAVAAFAAASFGPVIDLMYRLAEELGK